MPTPSVGSVAPLVHRLGRALGPLATLLIQVGNAVTPGRGFREGPFATQIELRELVDLAEQRGVVEHDEREMIHSVLALGDTHRPRGDGAAYRDGLGGGPPRPSRRRAAAWRCDRASPGFRSSAKPSTTCWASSTSRIWSAVPRPRARTFEVRVG